MGSFSDRLQTLLARFASMAWSMVLEFTSFLQPEQNFSSGRGTEINRDFTFLKTQWKVLCTTSNT